MKISKKKVTHENFLNAINIAHEVIKKLHPRTKLSYYCNQFIEINKAVTKEYNKKSKALASALNRELSDFMVDNALEKDGKLWLDDKGGYQYSKAGDKAVKLKQEQISEKIEEIVDPFLAEEIVVKCFVDELKLPEDIEQTIINALNGFVFKYIDPNHEEITEEEETA